MKVSVKLDGVEVLYDKLKEKSEADFLAVCKETTTYLRNQARANTPVKTTELRKSLRQENPSNGKDGVVGYTREYAPHVEYGHRVVNRNRETVGYVAGRYYLKKAVDAARTEFVRLAKEELKK